jgi:hypothetical protein
MLPQRNITLQRLAQSYAISYIIVDARKSQNLAKTKDHIRIGQRT